jgi:serine/threonine protein kinase
MSDSAYPDALPAQYRLHWYVLERVLGQGGFGITYYARDTNLDQAVAIKEYLPVDVATRRADTTVRPRTDEQADRYRWGLERFIQEARTLARFDHPNIVRVLSVFEHNGTAYMVMRFEEGENFAALLERRRTLPEDELMRVLLPVLDGLALVHGANFIHRDIKPDNIHIRADGSPVLLDFGSARHSVGQARMVTILVAPGYAPFEQYYSSGEDQGPWTDIYSLGATCYRAIAGAPPMDAIARSKGILGSTREILVPAAAVGAGRYTERLLKAVDHALAFADKDRPRSLAAWRAELVGNAATARAPQSAPASAAAAPQTPVTRTAALFATTVLIAAVAGGVGAYILMSREKPAIPVVAEPVAKPAPKVEVMTTPAVVVDSAPERTESPSPPRSELVTSKPKPQPPTLKPKPVKTEVATVEPPPVSVPPPEKTFTYYRELAGRGDAAAALRVGEMFESGRGVLANNNQAYFWYLIAEKRGVAGAADKKDIVARKLQRLEIEQMDKLARGVLQPKGEQ